MKLGFNLSIERKSLEEVLDEIKYYLSISDEVIELSLTALYGILDFPFDEITPYLKRFKYRSIHLPVVTGEDRTNNEFLVYPDKKIDKYLEIITDVAKKIDISAFVLHPDQVIDFSWAKNEFKNLLGFENMNSEKLFGKTIEDMRIAFNKCQDAKFIFDLNHLYTNDKTMKTAKSFYQAFKERLAHYHVSAFGGRHDTFLTNPDERLILNGISDISIPMVHEGYKYKKNSAKEEYIVIEDYLKNRFQKS